MCKYFSALLHLRDQWSDWLLMFTLSKQACRVFQIHWILIIIILFSWIVLFLYMHVSIFIIYTFFCTYMCSIFCTYVQNVSVTEEFPFLLSTWTIQRPTQSNYVHIWNHYNLPRSFNIIYWSSLLLTVCREILSHSDNQFILL